MHPHASRVPGNALTCRRREAQGGNRPTSLASKVALGDKTPSVTATPSRPSGVGWLAAATDSSLRMSCSWPGSRSDRPCRS